MEKRLQLSSHFSRLPGERPPSIAGVAGTARNSAFRLADLTQDARPDRVELPDFMDTSRMISII
jgi:hypothetical protein